MNPLALLGLAAAGIYALTKVKQAAAAPNLTFSPMNPKLGKNANGQSGIIVPISIFNPTTSQYVLTGITGSVSSGGQSVGALQYAGKQTIKANGYTTVDLFVVPDLAGILGSVINLISGGLKLPAMLITGKAFLGSFSIPFVIQTKGAQAGQSPTGLLPASEKILDKFTAVAKKPISGNLPTLVARTKEAMQDAANKAQVVVVQDTKGAVRAVPVSSIIAAPQNTAMRSGGMLPPPSKASQFSRS